MPNKQCPKCKNILSEDKFNKSNRRDGLQTYCRSCHNSIQREKYNNDPMAKVKRQLRAGRRKSLKPEAQRRSELKRLYGITLEQYVEMFVKQNEVCAVCKNSCITKKSLSVDHDHETGKVRGLLCNRCNRALGMFMDDENILLSAAAYVKKYKIN